MDILSGDDAVEAFQKRFSEAHRREVADWDPSELKEQTRLNAHQSAFAEHFAQCAPGAWEDLAFLQPLADIWLGHKWQLAVGTGTKDTPLKLADVSTLLNLGIQNWAQKYMISTTWVYATALVTLRAMSSSQVFSVERPTTLLHNTFSTMAISGETVELGQSSFTHVPYSTVIVCPDLGLQEWDTLTESRAQFRKRMIEAFTQELDDQLSRVDNPLLPEDLEVKWHWIDMTIERYAGGKSERATAKKHGVSRTAVGKAVEATRLALGFPQLPSDWGVTPIKKW